MTSFTHLHSSHPQPIRAPHHKARKSNSLALAAAALLLCSGESYAAGNTEETARAAVPAIPIELGGGAEASGHSIAIGNVAVAKVPATAGLDEDSIAIGNFATAGSGSAHSATSIGSSSQATGTGSVALGGDATASRDYAIGLGYKAKAEGTSSVAIGDLSTASGHESVAVGTRSQATGAGSVALGREARASGARSVRLGADSNATRANAVDIGNRVITSVGAGVQDSDAANIQQLRGAATALGGGASINPAGAFIAPSYSIGGMNHSTVGSALSNLDGRVKTNTDSIAEINAALEAGTGTGGPARAVTYDDDAKGIVSFAGASGTRLTNVAAGSITAGSTDAVNGGQIASLAQSFNAKLDGLDVRVTSLESNAGTGGGNGGNGGSSSVVDGPNGATSIGVGSALPQDYALSVGAPGSERRITNVAVGTAGTDAVNLNQLNAARDSAIQQSNSYTDLRFHQSQARVNDVARTAYSGVAMAMAMPNISPAKPGSTVVAAGTGGFQGYGAFGLGVTYRSPNGQVLVNGAVAYSNSGGAATRVQVGYEF